LAVSYPYKNLFISNTYNSLSTAFSVLWVVVTLLMKFYQRLMSSLKAHTPEKLREWI